MDTYYKYNLAGEFEQVDPKDVIADVSDRLNNQHLNCHALYGLVGTASCLTDLTKVLHEAQVKKGFWELDAEGIGFNLDQKLMLIVGEVAEAHEEYRSNNDPDHVYYRDDGKPEGFKFELADVFIRLADLCGALGIDLGAVVAEKHAFNEKRPHKHGRLF